MPSKSELPEELVRLADQPRVLVRRAGPWRKDGACVLYWMQRALRIVDNPALEVAIEAANLLALPVVVFFSVIANYPHANLRAYHFLAQGLRDAAQDAAERGLTFVVRRPPENRLEALVEETGAALVIGDENPCREPERWRRVLAQRLNVPFWTVDADVVVPSRVFGRSFALLHHFRPHLARELPRFLVAPQKIEPLYRFERTRNLAGFDLAQDITAGFTQLDRSVQPVDSFTGGTHAALKQLQVFLRSGLAHYEERRNHPEMDGTSRLSPYLHFGNIGPVTIALAAESAHAAPETKKRFLEQLIGWRELAVLFVRHEPSYDNWECAAPWARQSLMQHAADPRPYRYTLAQLERGETHDDLWNAAQRQMVTSGWMHNAMRMYWAKKMLEWSPDPATAFDWAVVLNDRYQVDGRDANGYAGIAWAMVGKLDRPWFDRPVFGLVRSMTRESYSRKFDAEAYIRKQR